MTTPTPRKRGAQPGNANALKHGFYARGILNAEANELAAIKDDGLSNEIDMLRVIMQRLFIMAGENDNDIENYIKILSVTGAAATRLSGLLKAQRLLSGESNDEITSNIAASLRAIQLKEGLING